MRDSAINSRTRLGHVPPDGVNDLSFAVRMVARELNWEPNWLPTATVIQPRPATSGLVIPAQTAHPAMSDIIQRPSAIA